METFSRRCRSVALAFSLSAGLLTIAELAAQSTTSGPTFEVASVKANRSSSPASRIQPSPGRFTATNISLRGLVRFAYEIQDFQVDGGPSWFGSDRFDIVAKAEGEPSPNEIRLMVRGLLADRFKMRTHSESREQALYVLVLAKNDGRLGPQLHKSEADCAAAIERPFARSTGGAQLCGSVGPAPGVPILSARLAFRGFTMDGFARFLAPVVRRVVVNRTSLTGYFDGEFDASAELPPPPPPPGSGIANPFDPQNMASIFSLLSEQLGLKLESTRGPVEILVIDGAERPSDD